MLVREVGCTLVLCLDLPLRGIEGGRRTLNVQPGGRISEGYRLWHS